MGDLPLLGNPYLRSRSSQYKCNNAHLQRTRRRQDNLVRRCKYLPSSYTRDTSGKSHENFCWPRANRRFWIGNNSVFAWIIKDVHALQWSQSKIFDKPSANKSFHATFLMYLWYMRMVSIYNSAQGYPGGDESFANGHYCIYTERSGSADMNFPEVVCYPFRGQKSLFGVIH